MRDLLVSHCTRFFSPFSLITFPPTIAFCFSCPILANEMRCGSAYIPFDRPHPNRVVCPYHVAISYVFDYRGWQVKHGLLIQRKCVGANIHAQSAQTHQPPTRNLSKRNRRGGACVPARTSAQRRFPYQEYTHCVRG